MVCISSSPQTLGQSVELLRQSCDCVQDPLLVLLLQPSFTSLGKLIRMPQRLLLPENFTKHRHVLSVHAVQHHIDHLLHRSSWSWPGDVVVAQLCAASRWAGVKSSSAAFLVPALLTQPSLFFFTRRSCQILFVLPLQPLMELSVALLFLLPLLFALPSFPPRGRRSQSLSFGVLFIEILSSDAISPVPEVCIIVINSKIIVGCETNTAVLLSSKESGN